MKNVGMPRKDVDAATLLLVPYVHVLVYPDSLLNPPMESNYMNAFNVYGEVVELDEETENEGRSNDVDETAQFSPVLIHLLTDAVKETVPLAASI